MGFGSRFTGTVLFSFAISGTAAIEGVFEEAGVVAGGVAMAHADVIVVNAPAEHHLGEHLRVQPFFFCAHVPIDEFAQLDVGAERSDSSETSAPYQHRACEVTGHGIAGIDRAAGSIVELLDPSENRFGRRIAGD